MHQLATAMDMSKPSSIIFVVVAASLVVFFIVRGIRKNNKRKRLLVEGVAATAKVNKMNQIGGTNTASGAVAVDFELTVMTREGVSVNAKIREPMPLLKLGRLSVGDEAHVRYDPNEPDKPVIDWSKV